MPNTLVGLVEGSSMFKKWYFEAELEHMEEMTSKAPYLRVGWANTGGFIAYPGSGDGWGGNGAGDDYYSWSFDGRRVWTGKWSVILCLTMTLGRVGASSPRGSGLVPKNSTGSGSEDRFLENRT